MIAVEGISRAYGPLQALDGVSLRLEPGSICGLLGANGAGKSTLFKILIGLIRPDAGSMTWNGAPMPFGDLRIRESAGYVPEEDLLDDYLTVVEFLEFVAAIRGVPTSERTDRLDRWIDFFELKEKRRTLLLDCSHGMRRKVSLAASFLGEPPLLLLDEAMNGLDPASRIRLRDELRRRRDLGCTILFSSHIIETIEPLCDRVVILSRGKVVADLAAAEWNRGAGKESLEARFLRATSSNPA